MSYDNEKIKFGKEHIYIVEMDLEYCSNTYGQVLCSASGQTGDSKCHNTRQNCQVLDVAGNFQASTKTYRFCESRSAHPIGLVAIPSLNNVSISPAKIDLAGGLGTRASVNLSFIDHPASDIDVDKYVAERSYIASERGSFWTKLRARNPNYQFRSLRVLSGYLENGVYIAANFKTRYYIIESMNVSGGKASIIAKDPLKLASTKKALAPKANSGVISSDLSIGSNHIILLPDGIGNLEYGESGFLSLRNEIMAYTRNPLSNPDRLEINRAEKNTIATTHSAGETVQQCLEYSGQVRGRLDFIINDLLTNFANIDAAFINTEAWEAEVSIFLKGLADGIVSKPYDVYKLLKELAESFPHYLWWNEYKQEIELTALKVAPSTALNALSMQSNIVEGSFSTKDKPDLRVSTIFVNFGMFDSTKKIDDIHNYRQSYTRIDAKSISKYGSSEVKVVNSRWINNANKAQAVVLATLYGRRFSDVPREINFSLDVKDSDVWIGDTKAINHIDIVDQTGLPVDTNFQIMSAKESNNFDYTALEYTYGDLQDGDVGGGNPNVTSVYIPKSNDVNLYDLYVDTWPAPTATTEALFIIDNGIIIGSSNNTIPSITTGTATEWNGANVEILIEPNGFLVGKGGDEGEAGGLALLMQTDITLSNAGVIGGGGGGGGHSQGSNYRAGGGGGAGFNFGIKGVTTYSGGAQSYGSNGTLESGGNGGYVITQAQEPENARGGDGGDLGNAGQSAIGDGTNNSGGAAGAAIDRNGFTLTESITGSDIRGANS